MRNMALIADDIEMNREILVDILGNEYDILEAADGVEALAQIESHHEELAVILLDFFMPNMTGLDVLAQLKAKGLDYIPVLMITAAADREIERQCYDYNITDFILKPFDELLIQRRVQNAVTSFFYQMNLEQQIAQQTQALQDRNRRLTEVNAEIVELLGNVVEARNMESGQHIRRVKKFSEILAHGVMEYYPEYGLTEEKIERIATASTLHDIGKIMIPDRILLKPEQLTDEEFEIMKKHTLFGCELLEHTEGVWKDSYGKEAYEICRSHHERYTGKGYPDGLKGEEIPISAQIVSIADCYDALTATRVYKRAVSKEVAFEMILGGECGEFSPKLLDCFVKKREQIEEIPTGAEPEEDTSLQEVRRGLRPEKSEPEPIQPEPITATPDLPNAKKKPRLSLVILIASLITLAIVLFQSIQTTILSNRSEELLELEELYFDFSEALTEFQNGHNTLTDYARRYCLTGDEQYLQNYFEEAGTTQSRENALNIIDQMSISSEARSRIDAAMCSSTTLMNVQYSAMRLTAIAYGVVESTLPEELQNAELEDSYLTLTAEEQKQTAINMLYTGFYEQETASLNNNLKAFGKSTMDLTMQQCKELDTILQSAIRLQRILIAAYVIFMVLFYLLIIFYVMNPLKKAIAIIHDGKPMRLRFAFSEYIRLMNSYNTLLESKELLEGDLHHLAEKDALTGLGNRTAYIIRISEMKRVFTMASRRCICIFDLDDLKGINDHYGHQAGDAVLNALGKRIQEIFHSENYAAYRIGGDEFAVIGEGVTENELRAQLYELRPFRIEVNGTHISVSASQGYSFINYAEEDSVTKAYMRADKAMYDNKRARKANNRTIGAKQ